MYKTEIYKKLIKSKKQVYRVSDLKKYLELKNDNSIYHAIKRLTKQEILERVANGVFCLKDNPASDFVIANNLYHPSYISLESALNYYGIVIQSPRTIFSITTRRNKIQKYEDKEFIYFRTKQNYFFDYIKEKDFLIATPEKALIDTIFFTALGRAKTDLSELVLDIVNKKKLHKIKNKIQNKAFHNLFENLKL